MEENKKIVMKIKKKKKKHVMKIKRINKQVEKAHKLKIYSTKKFYEKYLAENETPHDFITNIKFIVSQIEHIFKYNPDDLSPNQLSQILKSNVDIDMILGIIMETGNGKLRIMGIYDSCATILSKLYYIINRMQKEYGISVSRYDADDLRFKLQIMHTKYQPRQKLNRMMAIKDGVIMETSDNIVPSKSLSGTSIMVEYDLNRFVNVPYIYYKKLYNITSLNIHVQVAESYDVDFDMNTGEITTEKDDLCLYLDRVLESNDIRGHLNNIMHYITLWDSFDEMSIESGSPYIPYRECVKVVNDKGTKIYDIPCFLTEFVGFL